MQIIADLEVHSKYARAVSSSMNVPTISEWAAKKGISLVGTGDFTHPMWLRELEANLEEAGNGVYKLRDGKSSEPYFLLTSEISCMYTHEGKGRRVHIMVYLPSFESVKKFNNELTTMGANLFSDGRPIVGLTLAQIAETALSVDKRTILIPAHVWTPWFGFYGHMSGYDSLHEAFGDLKKYIPAVETGLSSDPLMNWKIEELEEKQIVSFGDAHSPQKLGREATVFELEKISYENVWKALWPKSEIGSRKLDDEVLISKLEVGIQSSKFKLRNQSSDIKPHISYTIEFYPEEGKYHYTGHRKCNVVYSPKDARKMGMTCPVCGRPLTLGVASRVETLASLDIETESTVDKYGVRFIRDKVGKRIPYIMMVPLLEIISESLGLGVNSQKVENTYELLINQLGSEFRVLLKTPIEDIRKVAGEKIGEAIGKVRIGDIHIEPGYDGIFGKVTIWRQEEKITNNHKLQESLF